MVSRLLKHPLFRSSVIYTLCDAFNKAVPFLVLPLLSYYLTPSDYGIVANFNILLAVATICVAISVEGAIAVNYYKLSKDKLAKYVYNSIVLISLTSLIVLSIAIVFKDLIYQSFKLPFNYIVWTVIMAFTATMTTINLSLWRLEEKPLKFGVYQISQTLINVVFSLVLVIIYKKGWRGRIDGILISTFMFGLYSLFLLWKRGYLKVRYDKAIILAIVSFGLPLIPHSLSMWIRSGVDRIYITNMIGEESTGLYATGFQFGTFVSFFILAFNNAYVPFIYKSLSSTDNNEIIANKKKLRKITLYIGLALVVCSICFYFISIVILNNFFNKSFLQSEDFIMYAIIGQVFQGFYLLFVNYIFFVKKTKGLAIITFTCSLIQVVLSYFLIKKFGAMGAAYSTVIVSFINFISVMIYSNRVFSLGWEIPILKELNK